MNFFSEHFTQPRQNIFSTRVHARTWGLCTRAPVFARFNNSRSESGGGISLTPLDERVENIQWQRLHLFHGDWCLDCRAICRCCMRIQIRYAFALRYRRTQTQSPTGTQRCNSHTKQAPDRELPPKPQRSFSPGSFRLLGSKGLRGGKKRSIRPPSFPGSSGLAPLACVRAKLASSLFDARVGNCWELRRVRRL